MARWNFRKILKIAIPVAVGVVCLIAVPYVAPLLVTFLGFGAGGIVAGTAAASFMSSYGGAVAAGGVIAILQSIGALGCRSCVILCGIYIESVQNPPYTGPAYIIMYKLCVMYQPTELCAASICESLLGTEYATNKN
ncbi:hypothetical protein BC938DRAFT_471974 [Jimgerdemannia flammicorona]|uniref:Uncharacterized protein n=1 Tax=Jimgerdemannia flammicorona TaxID=994334 RepID=A0A433QUF4_9FUNG|nr:hypothetical protein BC938DRAFT_471974 [Jimgerdemannia flammicorona]